MGGGNEKRGKEKTKYTIYKKQYYTDNTWRCENSLTATMERVVQRVKGREKRIMYPY